MLLFLESTRFKYCPSNPLPPVISIFTLFLLIEFYTIKVIEVYYFQTQLMTVFENHTYFGKFIKK